MQWRFEAAAGRYLGPAVARDAATNSGAAAASQRGRAELPVVLSHAHLDHSGALPVLVHHGDQGR